MNLFLGVHNAQPCDRAIWRYWNTRAAIFKFHSRKMHTFLMLKFEGVCIWEALLFRQEVTLLWIIKIYKVSPINEYLVRVCSTKIYILYNLNRYNFLKFNTVQCAKFSRDFGRPRCLYFIFEKYVEQITSAKVGERQSPVYCVAYSYILKKEASNYSETPFVSQQTT
jgi:hypothetical protein